MAINSIYKDSFALFLLVCICVQWECGVHACEDGYPQRPEGSDSSGAGVTAACESPDVSPGDGTWVLGKSILLLYLSIFGSLETESHYI